MQIQTKQLQTNPFEVVYYARSNKVCKSRKSSVTIIEKDRIKNKTKKVRKMTLNPQSVRFQQIKMSEKVHQRVSVKSLKEETIQQDVKQFDFSIFLELGPKNIYHENQQLQNGSTHGIVGETTQLDNDFKWSLSKQPTGTEQTESNYQS